MARRPGLGSGEDLANSKYVSVAVSFAAMLASANLAIGYTRIDEKWAPLFWVFATMSGVKMLHDVSR
jgi:hypothetical protein